MTLDDRFYEPIPTVNSISPKQRRDTKSPASGQGSGNEPSAEVESPSRMSVHFSSRTEEWETPQWLFDYLNQEFRFTLDPCSTDANAKCAKHFTKQEDGLRQLWADEVVFMNPPYGAAIAQWMKRAHDASVHEQATVVCLVPARTDTRWWHQYAMRHEIRFLPGRLRFGRSEQSAPFPSAIVVMRPAGFSLCAEETADFARRRR